MPRGYSKSPKETTCSCCGISFIQIKHQSKYCSSTCRKNMSYRFKQEKRDYSTYDEEYALIHNYGINKKQYNTLLQKQNGVCAICGKVHNHLSKTGKPRRLFVDHDHNTNEIRGLLCHSCNVALGLFKDSTESLAKAILYLQKGIK